MRGKRTVLVASGLVALLVAVAALLRRRSDGDPERPTADATESNRGHPFDVLDGHNYARLTTFRRSGEPVHTPVWFASIGDRLYATTPRDSGKMKRIRNDPRVVLAPCNARGKVRGDSVEALARPYDDDGRGEVALREKYGWQMGVAKRFMREEGIGEATLEIRAPGEPA